MANYITSFITATLNNTNSNLYNQWMEAHPGWYKISSKGARPFDGGLNIVENIEYAANSSVAFRDPKATIGLTEEETMRNVSFAPKYITGGLPIFKEDELINRSKEQIFDYGKAKIDNLMRTMKHTLAEALYDSGGNGALDGLGSICSASNVYPVADDKTQITGINRSTSGNEYWQAQVHSTSEAWSISGGTDGGWAHSYDATLIYEGDDPNDEPDLIITTQALYQKYMDTLADNQRFQNDDLAGHGFRNLKFRNASVVWDNNVTAGYTYILNTKHIHLRPHTECNGKFILEDKHPMEDRFAARILVMWVGNITCTMPRKQAIITGKS